MLKRLLMVAVAYGGMVAPQTLCKPACALPPTKAWHQSPSANPMSSTAYSVVDWDRVEQVRIGMCASEAESVLGGSLEYYHHPINAIVYSRNASCGPIEVAFKLSKEHCIEDISYKGENIDAAPTSAAPSAGSTPRP